MSAAPYAHQLHTKPTILGLNFSPVVIGSQLLVLVSGFWIPDAGRPGKGFFIISGIEHLISSI